MQTITIAMADIVQRDVHLLQHRNHDPNKPAAGLIGFFGGQLEPEELPKQALVRELSEETNLLVSINDLKTVGSFAVNMSHKGKKLHILGNCYRIELPESTVMVAIEGEIAQMTDQELITRLDELTPATATVIKQYFMEKEQYGIRSN